MTRAARALAAIAFLAAVALLAWFWPHARNEIFVLSGARDEPGGWYGFHSGLGGAAYVSLVPFGLLLWWHHTCHAPRCLWPGRHTVDGTRWCNRHHLDARRNLAATGSAHDLEAS